MIWPPNSNRTAFWREICRKLAKYPIQPIFDRQIDSYKKGVKCYLILILRPDLESSNHFASLRNPFDMIFTFRFLTSHVILFDHKWGQGYHFLENVNFDALTVISVKNTFKCIHQFNIHIGVFGFAWGLIPKLCGAESAQCSGQLFR